jgi:hypothetical protein
MRSCSFSSVQQRRGGGAHNSKDRMVAKFVLGSEECINNSAIHQAQALERPGAGVYCLILSTKVWHSGLPSREGMAFSQAACFRTGKNARVCQGNGFESVPSSVLRTTYLFNTY